LETVIAQIVSLRVRVHAFEPEISYVSFLRRQDLMVKIFCFFVANNFSVGETPAGGWNRAHPARHSWAGRNLKFHRWCKPVRKLRQHKCATPVWTPARKIYSGGASPGRATKARPCLMLVTKN